jgi:phytanoyl-CoA hydroxylase
MANTLTAEVKVSDSPTTFRSRFGGLWTDLTNAIDTVNAQLDQNIVSREEAEQLRHWITHGYVIIENAVPHDVIDRVVLDTELAWSGKFPSIFVEHFVNNQLTFSPACPKLRNAFGKMLDLYAVSQATRDAIFADPLRKFLNLVFKRPALAFQSLSFMAGTGQPIHQDTAYVVVNSPMEFAASWIALEDIQPNSGELEYYEGSHKMPEFLFQGKYKNMPLGDPDHLKYLQSLHDKAADMGLNRKKFRAKKGDALIWSADLAHGDSQDRAPNTSRLSIVTHYCPFELEPAYFQSVSHSGRVAHRRDSFYAYPLR